jgi:hypothetical protein
MCAHHQFGSSGFDVLVYHIPKKVHFCWRCFLLCDSWNKIQSPVFLSRMQRIISRNFRLIRPFPGAVVWFFFTFYMIPAVLLPRWSSKVSAWFSNNLSKAPVSASLFRSSTSRITWKWMAYVHDPYPATLSATLQLVESSHKAREAFGSFWTKAKYSAFPSLLLHEWMSPFLILLPNRKAAFKKDKTQSTCFEFFLSFLFWCFKIQRIACR